MNNSHLDLPSISPIEAKHSGNKPKKMQILLSAILMRNEINLLINFQKNKIQLDQPDEQNKHSIKFKKKQKI